MKFMLIIHGDETAQAMMSPADRERVFAAFRAYTEAMNTAGVRRGGEALLPSARGARVQVRGDKTSVVDGPFAEAREVIGGYYVIDTPTRDFALEWAARCPGATFGTMEVREVIDLEYTQGMTHQ